MAQIQWKLPEILLALFDYWHSKRLGAGLPGVAAIARGDIPQIEPHLMLLAPLWGGEDFCYRFMGAAVIQATGLDCTGKRMTEVLPVGPYLDYLLGLNREVMAERKPLYSESSFRSDRLSMRWTCRIILPLSEAPSGVDMIMAAQVFGGPSPIAPVPSFSAMTEFEEGVRVLLD